MALTVGQLRVELEVRLAAFRRNMRAATTQVRTFATRSRAALAGVGRAFSSLRANIGTLTAGAGIIGGLGVALVAATRAAAGSVDEIAKAARQSNVTATEFQRLTFAAEEAGVETQGFANSLLLFNRNIGEALTGIGPGAEAFAALGVEIRDLRTGELKDIQTLFGEVSDALQTVPTGAQRAQIAFDLFGRQGAKLAPLLALGSRAIRETGDEAERLGLIFSEDIVAQSEVVNDAFGRLSRAVDVQLKSALIDLAPAILDLAGSILPQLITGVRVVVGALNILRGILAVVQLAVVALLTPLNFLSRTFVDLVNVVRDAGGVISAVFRRDFAGAREEAARLGDAFGRDLVGNFNQGVAEVQAAAAVAGEAFDEFSQGDAALAAVNARFEQVAADARAAAEGLRSGAASAQAAREAAERTTGGAIIDPNALRQQQELATAQQQGAARLLALETQRAQEAARLAGPLEAQRFAIQQQITALQEATLSDADRVRANALINTLVAEQNDLLARQTSATEAIPALTANVNTLIGNLAALDPEQAAEFANELGRRVATAVGPEAKEAELVALGQEVAVSIDEATRNQELSGLTEGVVAGVDQGFQDVIGGGGFDGFLTSFADGLSSSTQEGLEAGFAPALDSLGKSLESILPASFAGQGGAILGAAAGVAGSLVSAALRDSDVQSSAARVSSAITSAQQTRGIVAGPTSIGVAQVQRGIQEAFEEPTRLLNVIARSNAQIASNTGGSGTGSIGPSFDEAAQTLADEGPALT